MSRMYWPGREPHARLDGYVRNAGDHPVLRGRLRVWYTYASPRAYTVFEDARGVTMLVQDAFPDLRGSLFDEDNWINPGRGDR